jgi:hypothetical protein
MWFMALKKRRALKNGPLGTGGLQLPTAWAKPGSYQQLSRINKNWSSDVLEISACVYFCFSLSCHALSNSLRFRTLPIDGSRDDELDIKGLPGVQVGNWWEDTGLDFEKETPEQLYADVDAAADEDEGAEFVGDYER